MRFAVNRSRSALLVTLLFMGTVPSVRAQAGDDLDAYKWRAQGFWWFSQPTGSFTASSDQVSFDLNKDFHFASYSTFTGKIDYHFKRKHHLLFAVSPLTSSRTATINRNITFQGVTYDAGAQVTADLRSLGFAPGYQYDIFRRDHGYLAIQVSINLLDTKGTLTGIGTVNGISATRSASGSVFAPLPVLGPKFRWYPLHDSNRFSLDGAFQGMYFFGYGDFLSAQGTAGVAASRHFAFRAGYQLGTRFSIHGSSSQVGVRLTQKGPVVGIEASW